MSFLGVMVSAFRLILKMKANAELVKLLRRDKELKLILRRRNIIVHGKNYVDMSYDDYLAVRKFIKKELEELKLLQRHCVEEALNQPSIRGREDYAAKLIEGAFLTNDLAQKH